MSFEGLDNDHGRTAGGAGVGTCRAVILIHLHIRSTGITGVIGQQFAQPGQLFGPHGVSEQAVMTDAVEACGQYVDEKAPDELGRGQGLAANAGPRCPGTSDSAATRPAAAPAMTVTAWRSGRAVPYLD